MPFNLVFRISTIVPLSFARHQRISTAILPPLAILHNECDETSPYIPSPLLCQSVNHVLRQLHVDTLQLLTDNERVSREEEGGSLTIGEIRSPSPTKHKGPRADFPQLLSEFEDICNGNPDIIKKVRHQIELTSANMRHVQSSPYCTCSIVRNLSVKKTAYNKEDTRDAARKSCQAENIE